MATKEITQEKLDKVTRLEVINYTTNHYPIGRLVTLYKNEKGLGFGSIEMQLQDGGRTLKIFINEKENDT